MIRIAIIGPESTGKSVLAKKLAQHYGTVWVPEYAREYLERLDRPYREQDLLHIAKGQISLEREKEQKSNGILFCDTNLVVIKVWSDFKYMHTDPWIEHMIHTRTYDHYLLTNIDLPWEPDPLREHPTMREDLFKIYQNLLAELNLHHSIIEGQGDQRINSAIAIVDELFIH